MALPDKSSERDFIAKAQQSLPWLPPLIISLSEITHANTSTKISDKEITSENKCGGLYSSSYYFSISLYELEYMGYKQWKFFFSVLTLIYA